MKNNLEQKIKESGLTKIEFGIKALEMPAKTDNEIQAIRNKVNHYCSENLKSIKFSILEKFCEILKTNPNELYGYPETQ